MGGSKGIVNVKITQRGELFGKPRIVLLFFRMETKILEQQHSAWSGLHGLHFGTDMSRGQEREEDCHVRGHAERSGRVVEHPVRSHEDVGFGYRNNQRARRSGEPSRDCEPTGAPAGWCDRVRGSRAARWHYGPALIREQSVFESTARPCAGSLRACSPVAQMKLFRRHRTVTVYLDGRKALEFKRVRGPSGEYELDLVCRAGDVSDETVDRVREDIIRRWVWRDEER